ncbi:MAG: hypothetical protein EPO36_12120 [Chloroflexota bacterium]|nr:MAG: hypothetical protein EPO36_12120 [Chloroflexota bacterium]
MRISNPQPPTADVVIEAAGGPAARLSLPAVRIAAVVLGALLLGYMFLGRGFAHLGFPPLYIGEIVLASCIVATGFAFWRNGVRVAPSRIVWLLVGLMVLGAVRTLPYLGQYGFDALRDAALWGYAAFALLVFALADRDLVVRAFRLYGWVVPAFAIWLPISYYIFANASREIDPLRPGSVIPLIFFKGGDMAVHIVGAVAFLVLGAARTSSAWSVLQRVVIGIPLFWAAFVAGAANRGGLLTVIAGIAVVVALAPRSRNWLPLLLAIAVLVGGLTVQGAMSAPGGAGPSPTASAAPTMSAPPSPSPSPSAGASPAPSHSLGPTASDGPTSSASAGPAGTLPPGASPSGPPELGELRIANPGFELGELNSGIEGWAPSGVGTYTIVGDGGHRDSRFAAVDNTGAGYQATLTSSRFDFPAGEDIEVSLWAKAIRGQPTVEIYVNWYDRSGRLISSDFLDDLATAGARNWQRGVGLGQAPPGAGRAEVLLWEAAGHAAIGIDDVTVRAGDFIEEPPVVPPPEGRPATLNQLIENILSLFGPSSDVNLEGTKQFRLAWWGRIVDYTVRGEYFWTGKGFGVNLADDDGFQSTADHSLRAPHNSHFTVLARMGVPGIVLWLLILGSFGVGLLRAVLASRRAGDLGLAALGGCVLAYWVAMLVDTSFDPYLEGPQGGIWFWTIVGLGLVVMRQASRRPTP